MDLQNRAQAPSAPQGPQARSFALYAAPGALGSTLSPLNRSEGVAMPPPPLTVTRRDREFDAKAPRVLAAMVHGLQESDCFVPYEAARAVQGGLEGRVVTARELVEALVQVLGCQGPKASADLPHCLLEAIANRDWELEKDLRSRTQATGNETPWGRAVAVVHMLPGVDHYMTLDGGGYVLDAGAQASMAPGLAVSGGFYEERSGWARIALSFPEVFYAEELGRAHQVAQAEFPEAYRTFTGLKAAS